VKTAKYLLIPLLILCCCILSGCLGMLLAAGDHLIYDLTPAKGPYIDQLRDSYCQIDLKQSTSADVLAIIQRDEYEELLSQSESVVACWGEKQRSRRLRQMWFTMVTFDEDILTAKRKYFFMIDEWPKQWLRQRQLRMQFDTEIVMAPEVLQKPYANENARRIGILQQALTDFQDDMRALRTDNKIFYQCGMVVNQTFEGILTWLDSSPQFASRLARLKGMDFDHISIGKGKIRLVVRDDVVKIKIKIGSLAKNFEQHEDVNDM